MKKLIFILLPVCILILYFIFKSPTTQSDGLKQKPVYEPGTPEYIQQVHEDQVERGDRSRTDLWSLKIKKSELAEAHKAAIKCMTFKSEKPNGAVILIFSVTPDRNLNNFELDPPVPNSNLDQNCLTAAYLSLGLQIGFHQTDQWGRDRFQASEFVNQN